MTPLINLAMGFVKTRNCTGWGRGKAEINVLQHVLINSPTSPLDVIVLKSRFTYSCATVGLPVFCRKEKEAQKEYEEKHKKILEDAKRNHEKAFCFLRKSMAR